MSLLRRPGSGIMDTAEYSKVPSSSTEPLPKIVYRDPESLEEIPMAPGLSRSENALRWGFVRKVYGIVSCQLILTALVAGLIYFNPRVQHFVLQSVAFQVTCAILPLLGLIPLYIYQRKHPHNIIILALWTACFSVGIGTICTLYKPVVVLEALLLTAAIVAGLTAYTFHAVRKGKSFSQWGPFLFSGLVAMVMWGIVQLVVGQWLHQKFPAGDTIFALLGALLFAAYIVFDTEMLMIRFDLDDYVWASVNLYLDIINLFVRLLQLLGQRQN